MSPRRIRHVVDRVSNAAIVLAGVIGLLAVVAVVAVKLAEHHRRDFVPSPDDVDRSVGDFETMTETQQRADLVLLFHRGARLSTSEIQCIVNALCSNALIGDLNRQTMLRVCREGGKPLEAALLERLLESLKATGSCKPGGSQALLNALEAIDPTYRAARSREAATLANPDKVQEIGASRGVR